jgi:hypothetical protein
MPDIQESSEVIHRIEPETSGESDARFDELVRLLEQELNER